MPNTKELMMKLESFLNLHDRQLSRINTQTASTSKEKKGFAALLLVEEMAELTQEIVKIYVRNKTDRDKNFHEELADVILVLDQIVRHADQVLLDQKLCYKMNRYEERYGAGQ
jgi:NTP pyrophosphatase (non-canonical NTP hydrolase)